MKLGIMSDLHNEYDRRGRREDVPKPLPAGHPRVGPDLRELKGKIDVLLLAGDIDEGREAVRYGAAAAKYLDVPIVMIAGNHEFYNGSFDEVLAGLQAEADRQENVHFLENSAAIFEFGDSKDAGASRQRLRVLGCSLWTDYALFGADEKTVDRAMSIAGEGMSDHWVIRKSAGEGVFTPDHALARYLRSRAWLEQALAQGFAGTTIVMTHHGVSARSLPAQFKNSPLSAGFVSNLDDFVARSSVPLWLHGHTHFDVDYIIGSTRIVACQRGYPHESEAYRPAIIAL